MGKLKSSFYAVSRGRNVGIFPTWEECKIQVNGFSFARFKKFFSRPEAESYIKQEITNNLQPQSNVTSIGDGTKRIFATSEEEEAKRLKGEVAVSPNETYAQDQTISDVSSEDINETSPPPRRRKCKQRHNRLCCRCNHNLRNRRARRARRRQRARSNSSSQNETSFCSM